MSTLPGVRPGFYPNAERSLADGAAARPVRAGIREIGVPARVQYAGTRARRAGRQAHRAGSRVHYDPAQVTYAGSRID